MKFDDHYATAVRAKNLKSEFRTTRSSTDVLAAAAFASLRAPLALALLRLFTGDNHASREIVNLMSGMVDGKAYRLGVVMSRFDALDMARMVLAWARDGTCKSCGGLGFKKIEGAPHLDARPCHACRATPGKRPFDDEFPAERRELARWLLAEVEREISKAAPVAMAYLSTGLDL